MHIENNPDNRLLGEDLSGSAKDLHLKLLRLSKAHAHTQSLSNYIISTDYFDIKLFNTLRDCGSWLVFRHYFLQDQYRLRGASFCRKHLLCQFCAMRRASKQLSAYLSRFNTLIAQDPSLKPYFVTLTIKDRADCKDALLHLQTSLKSYSYFARAYKTNPKKYRHVEFAKSLGSVAVYEVTRGKNSGLWHWHVHMIWLCHNEPDKYKLSYEWHDITQDSYIVDVRLMASQPDQLVKSFCEVFKYTCKFSDLTFDDNLHLYLTAKGSRLIASYGLFRGVVVSDDLLDDEIKNEPFIDYMFNYSFGKYVNVGVTNSFRALEQDKIVNKFLDVSLNYFKKRLI